jgi:hypothetical protein
MWNDRRMNMDFIVHQELDRRLTLTLQGKNFLGALMDFEEVERFFQCIS